MAALAGAQTVSTQNPDDPRRVEELERANASLRRSARRWRHAFTALAVAGALVGAATRALPGPQDNPPPADAPGPGQEVVIVGDEIVPTYANFARVTATPEEVILDFALNPQPFQAGKQEVHANQRIVVGFYTAKRLLLALGMTLQRHEKTFGSIEIDPRKRAEAAKGKGTRDERS
jgi:hypothetical protein